VPEWTRCARGKEELGAQAAFAHQPNASIPGHWISLAPHPHSLRPGIRSGDSLSSSGLGCDSHLLEALWKDDVVHLNPWLTILAQVPWECCVCLNCSRAVGRCQVMDGLGCSGTAGCTVCQDPGSLLLALLKCEEEDAISERIDSRQTKLEKDIPLALPRWKDLTEEERAAAPKPAEHRDTSTADWRKLVKGWLVSVEARRKARMNPRQWLDGDCSPAKDPPLLPGVYEAGSGKLLGIAVDKVYVASGGGLMVVQKICDCGGW